METRGSRLRRFLLAQTGGEHGWINALAEKSGVKRQTLSAWMGDRAEPEMASLTAVAEALGCGGAAATPTPCVVSYPPAIGANVIVYFPNTTDAQCPGMVGAVPGSARLLAVPTGAPRCSGTTPNGDSVKVFGDSIASNALCAGLQPGTAP